MTAFLTSLASVAEIIIVIALGFYLRSKGKFDDHFKGSISFLIMNIALPASIFVSVSKYLTRDKLIELSGGILYAVISGSIGNQLPTLESSTLIIQSAAPGLAVLPILAGQAHGDVEYATNVVTTSTVLFVIVVPILMALIQFI